MTDIQPEGHVSRRDFMSITIWSIAGFITLGLGIPAIIYITGPALQRKNAAESWIRLGPTTKVEIGVPTLFKASVTQQTGWITNEQEIAVYVLTEDGRSYIALSNVCTHLGCRVRWITDKNQYYCPCHNGVFEKQGAVVSGPPPRPLDRYDVKVEEGLIFIKVG